MQKLIIILTLLLVSCVTKEEKQLSEAPKAWYTSILFNLQASKVWDMHSTNGKLDQSKFLDFCYSKFGSVSNPDNQFRTALAFCSLQKDPYTTFLTYLKSDDPKKIIFIMKVIQVLGDKRFVSHLAEFEHDKREAYDFKGYRLDKNASSTIEVIREESELKTEPQLNQFVQKWLTDSWAIKLKK